MTLQEICRIEVRRILHENICKEHPEIVKPEKPIKPPKQTKATRRRRINIAPMGMGMVLLGNLPDTDSEEEGADHSEDSSRDSDASHDVSGLERGDDPEEYIIQQMLAMQRRFLVMSRREHLEQLQEQDDDEDGGAEGNQEDEEDQGISEPMDDAEEEQKGENNSRVAAERTDQCSSDNAAGSEEDKINSISDMFGERQMFREYRRTDIVTSVDDKLELSEATIDDQDTDVIMTNTVSHAIPISQSNSERCRYSSTTSISTSFTSGIGTCSSIEESADLDGITPELGTHVEEVDTKDDFSFQEDLSPSPPETNNGARDKSAAGLEENAIKAYVATIKKQDYTRDDSSDCYVDCSQRSNGVTSSHAMTETVSKTPPKIAIGNESMVATSGENESHKKGSDSDGDVNDIDMERSEAKEEPKKQLSVTEQVSTFRQCLREKVEKLPIPLALKQYILFYRM